MRDDLLKELENEYEQLRAEHERTELDRKDQIRIKEPDIFALVQKREELVFGTLRDILRGNAGTDGLPGQMEQVSNEIRNKLTERGYGPEFLAPIYRCPICKDTGRVGDPVREPCTCFRKAYQKKLRERIGLSGEKRETFETFRLDLFSDEKIPGKTFSQREQMEMLRETCREWADTYPHHSSRDLILSGKSGLGKTFLLRAMTERLIERDVNVLLISAYQMLEELRKEFFSREDTSADDLFTAEVLMIDDLGSEPMMQNITVEQFFNLLNERQNRGLSTVISTNLSLEEFRNRYTERIASRLRDRKYCRILTICGKDIRAGGTRE